MSQAMQKIIDMVKFLKVVWIVLCILVLAVSIYFGDAKTGRDIDVFLIWSMMLFSFPASWIIILLFSIVSYALHSWFSVKLSVESDFGFYGYLFLIWFAFFVSGLFQWFILLPWLFVKFRFFKEKGR